MQNMVKLVKFVRRLGKTSPLGDIIGARASPPSPTSRTILFFLAAREHNLGPEVQTDEELVAWIKQYTNSIARMYRPSSPTLLPIQDR
jgi:hypothetical protein